MVILNQVIVHQEQAPLVKYLLRKYYACLEVADLKASILVRTYLKTP